MKSPNRVRKDTKSPRPARQEKASASEVSDIQKKAAFIAQHGTQELAAKVLADLDRAAWSIEARQREARCAALVIEPRMAGRPLLPSLSEREAAAFMALAIHNAAPVLENICHGYIANDKAREAGQLAEALVIASAVVRRRVLAGILDESEHDRFPLPLPGLAGLVPCDYGEALLYMSFALCDHEEQFDAPLFPQKAILAELMQALAIAAEVIRKSGIRAAPNREKSEPGESAIWHEKNAWGWNAAAILPALTKAA